MRQASAWGQFWWDLAKLHNAHGCGITTPLQPGRAETWRGLYHSTWYRSTPKGPVYYSVDGDTMIAMLRDGLNKLGCNTLHMKIGLLKVAIEQVLYQLEKSPVTWPFHAQHPGAKRLSSKCPTSTILWTASRVLCDVHWLWDEELRCYKTHQFTRDNKYHDLRAWPADNPLSSLRRAIHEDDRLAGDPTIRLLLLHISMEYVRALVEERKL